MDSSAKYPNQDELPSAADIPYLNDQSAGYNALYSSSNVSGFGAHWGLDSFQDPHNPSAVYQHAEPGWQPSPMNITNSAQVSNYGNPSTSYGLPFSSSSAPFDFPTFNQQTGQPFSTASYDTSLTYGHGHLLDSRNFDPASIADFARGGTQNGTVSPQVLQSYPNAYGSGVGVSTDFQSQQSHGNGNLISQNAALTHQPRDFSAGDAQLQTEVPRIPPGSVDGDFLVHDLKRFATITDSTALQGFAFLGNKALDLDTTKSTIPRFVPRKSRNELSRLRLDANGDNSWSEARRPPSKKLKVAVPKAARPRGFGPGDSSRTSNSAREETTSESSSESEPDDDSDYDSGSEEEVGVQETSPLPTIRPTDPSKATEYDIIKAVWAPRASPPAPAAIRTALGDYWNIVRSLRDAWKADSTSLQQAEDGKQTARIPDLKRKVLAQRNLMEVIFAKTLEHGHKDIIEKLGENSSLILVFYQFIADRFKDADYSGSMITRILELMSRCVTLDQAVLEKTKFDKVLPRLIKRGDGRVGKLAQTILDNAAALAKKKAESSHDARDASVKEKGPLKTLPTSKPPPEPVSLARRPKEGEKNAVLPQKKAIPATSTSVSRAPGSIKGTGIFSKRPSVSTADNKSAVSTSAQNAAKPKTNHIAAKPSGFFSSLQSASKKPGTSNAALQAAQQKDGKASTTTDKKTSTPTASMGAAPKPLFSFAETMANLTKPKEVEPSVKSEDNRPLETEEEKRKRLRKEERRKLRVSFKPDDSLTEIRLFTHDPEEEVGHEDSMMRDVDDIGGEGRMLKMHKDLNMMDEEEDVVAGEEELEPWRSPSLVDFSLIEREERERNCSTRSGFVEVKSQERAIQEQRELSTLMVVYTSIADVPPSPREPSDPFTGEQSQELSFGSPYEKTKARESQYYADLNSQRQPAPPAAPPSAPPVDIMALLSTLNGSQQQTSQPHLPQQAVSQAPQTDIERIFAQFSGGQQQPAPQPFMQQPQATMQAPMPGFDLQSALAAFSQNNQAQQQPALHNQVSQVQALLAQMGQPSSAQSQGYGYPTQYQTDYDRKRSYPGWGDTDGPNDYGGGDLGYGESGSNKRQKWVKDKKKMIPRVPCKFWNEGNCKKGGDCTYIHD